MGQSIVEDLGGARRYLGFCPQSNVLYEGLTVVEHLQLYAAVKGIAGGAFGKKAAKAASKAMTVCSAPGIWTFPSA